MEIAISFMANYGYVVCFSAYFFSLRVKLVSTLVSLELSWIVNLSANCTVLLLVFYLNFMTALHLIYQTGHNHKLLNGVVNQFKTDLYDSNSIWIFRNAKSNYLYLSIRSTVVINRIREHYINKHQSPKPFYIELEDSHKVDIYGILSLRLLTMLMIILKL